MSKKKNTNKKSGIAKKIIFGIMLMLSITVGFFVAKAKLTITQSLNHVTRDYDSKLSKVDLKGIKVKSDKNIVNILLIGNDARVEKGYENERGLMDVIMIATMDKKHGTLKLSSIMRDTIVYVPDAGKNMKINAATNYEGGVQSLYKTIAQNFNVKLDGYVQVSFDSFRKVVNALGGVEVELTDSEMRYLSQTNYIKKKKNRQGLIVGKQVLNGDQALGYCRIRKGMDIIGEPVVTVSGLTDDFGRTWRQRAVLGAAFAKLKTMPMSKWYDIANAVLEDIVTDLENDDIIKYMKDVALMGTTDIHQLQIPRNPYYRDSYKDEFPDGSCLVPTDGVSSDVNPEMNSKVLNQFIFEYDGEEEFEFVESGETE